MMMNDGEREKKNEIKKQNQNQEKSPHEHVNIKRKNSACVFVCVRVLRGNGKQRKLVSCELKKVSETFLTKNFIIKKKLNNLIIN